MERREIIRPAVWLGFTAFGTLLTATFLEISYSLFLCIGSAFLSILFLLTRIYKRNPYALLVLLTASFFFGYYFCSYALEVVPFEPYTGETYPIQAKILSLPDEDNGNFYYKAHVYSIGDPAKPTDFTIYLSHRESLNTEIGDEILCTVKFYDFESQTGLSSKTSNLAKGNVLGGYITDHELLTVLKSDVRSFRYHLSSLRKYLENKTTSVLSLEEASVLSAMLIGIRDTIPETLNNSYRTAGASHILVISGMHMSILTQSILGTLLFLGIRRRYAIICTYPAVLLFMAVSGFSVSVLRSGIMQIILLTGLLLGRKADSLNSLAIAALILLLFDPFAIGDVSLLLSFTATLGMISLSPRMIEFCTSRIQNKKFKRSVLLLLTPIVSSVSAVLGTLPVQVYVFGTVNILSILTSLLVLYISAWIIRLGIPTVILLSVPVLTPTAAPLILATGLLVRFQNFIVKTISSLFPNPLYISGKYVHSVVLITILFLLLSRWISGKNPLSIVAYISAAVIFVCASTVNYFTSYNEIKLLILDNDYTHCLALQQNSKAVIFSCKGNGYLISDFLRNNGTDTLEWMFFGSEENEIRCSEVLVSDFKTLNVLLPDSVYYPSSENKYMYHYGTSVSVLNDINVNLSSDGDWITFKLYDKEIIIDTNKTGYLPQTADILITDEYSGQTTGSLTILCSDNSYADSVQNLRNGDYLFTDDNEAICLAFKPDGTYTIRNG